MMPESTLCHGGRPALKTTDKEGESPAFPRANRPDTQTLRVLSLLLSLLGTSRPALSEVVRFEITERVPFAGGKAFGRVGAYERIIGRVFFSIDPQAPQNASIVDLEQAPRTSEGRVEFNAELFVLAPADLRRGNGAALYSVNNRGNKLALRFFNDGPNGNSPSSRADAGNSFLFKAGFTVVWSGWDGELLPGKNRLQLMAPVATGTQATAREAMITGPVRYEIIPEEEGTRLPANGTGHGAYRPTLRGVEEVTLSWRQRPSDPRVPIPRDQFHLHVTETTPSSPGQLPLVELELPAGFRVGYLYELRYEAQDPLVHGVTFASVRDLMTAFKHGEGTDNPLKKTPHGGARNPGTLARAHSFGVSQSGRFLREFLHAGFNQDERGRKVFDGVMTHVAGGGLGSFNHRFAQPTAYGTQYAQHDTPSDRFPFAYETQRDSLAGGSEDGVLDTVRPEHLPRIFHTQSSAEYWSRCGSLPHTDPLGQRDADLPDTVRLYTFGGTQHGPSSYPPTRGSGQNLRNPADYRPFLRALLLALDAWVRDGTAPPPSVHPTIHGGTLVDFHQTSTGFPSIPGVRYPSVIHAPSILDFGPRWKSDRIIDRQPPRKGPQYRVLAARTDADGNPLGCLLPPEVAVPLATFTGWNLRHREAGAQNQLVGLAGSYIPFAKTRAERARLGDPRPSVEERYSSLEAYTAELRKACLELVRGRYLREEEIEPIVKRQVARAKEVFEASAGNGKE
jgi:hypothetical protein